MTSEETITQTPYVTLGEALRAGADALYESAREYEDQADRGFYGGRDYSEKLSDNCRKHAARLRAQADRLLVECRSR